jgi:hypothetical protein
MTADNKNGFQAFKPVYLLSVGIILIYPAVLPVLAWIYKTDLPGGTAS